MLPDISKKRSQWRSASSRPVRGGQLACSAAGDQAGQDRWAPAVREQPAAQREAEEEPDRGTVCGMRASTERAQVEYLEATWATLRLYDFCSVLW